MSRDSGIFSLRLEEVVSFLRAYLKRRKTSLSLNVQMRNTEYLHCMRAKNNKKRKKKRKGKKRKKQILRAGISTKRRQRVEPGKFIKYSSLSSFSSKGRRGSHTQCSRPNLMLKRFLLFFFIRYCTATVPNAALKASPFFFLLILLVLL